MRRVTSSGIGNTLNVGIVSLPSLWLEIDRNHHRKTNLSVSCGPIFSALLCILGGPAFQSDRSFLNLLLHPSTLSVVEIIPSDSSSLHAPLVGSIAVLDGLISGKASSDTSSVSFSCARMDGD